MNRIIPLRPVGATVPPTVTSVDPHAIVLVSDRRAFCERVVSLGRARGTAAMVECADAATLFSEFDLAVPRVVIVDLEHGGDDPVATVAQVRARWPNVIVAALGLPRAPASRAADDEAPVDDEWLVDALLASDPRAGNPASSYSEIWARLTPRQREVLAHLAEGEDNLKIAACLGITERAVKAHVSALLHAFAAENRTQLAILVSHARGRG